MKSPGREQAMKRSYVPDIGDIVWLDFDPQVGREQAKRRPALVLTPKGYNAVSELMICCPLTSQSKGYPFEVLVQSANNSVALADQVKSVDWKRRRADFLSTATDDEVTEIREKLAILIGF